MGTNYYLHEKPPCECCGRPYDALHIGKSSAGWCFTLHVEPDEGISDLADWIERWSKPGAVIRDEYGQEVTQEEMFAAITIRGPGRGKGNLSERDYQIWLAQNHAVEGPNGLMRHRLDERFCVKHGEGTWDCCPGEFS